MIAPNGTNMSNRDILLIKDEVPNKNSCKRQSFDFLKFNLTVKFKNWVKHPKNMAIFLWHLSVVAYLLAIFLFMAGILNHAIPKNTVRKRWIEILNQILNALFTIMCLYQHPRLTHHLVLLFRWRSSDIAKVKSMYCKSVTTKHNVRAQVMFVVILLHLTCLFQYGLCALFWAYTRTTRPGWPQTLFIVLGTLAPIVAGVYTFLGPLSRKEEAVNDEEAQRHGCTVINYNTNENGTRKYHKRMVEVTSPVWNGGVFDCLDDHFVAYLSFFCTFCAFGWNMERLGLGNMYVHIVTFLLFCSAPFIVFSLTALQIDNDATKYLVGIVGIILCFLGLLYGGFWRIEMRKKFKLPTSKLCCGNATFNDFMQWLFCWSCSLAQEIRTGNLYFIKDDKLYEKDSLKDTNQQQKFPLARENGASMVSLPSFKSSTIHSIININSELEILDTELKGEIHEFMSDEIMRPPLQVEASKEDA